MTLDSRLIVIDPVLDPKGMFDFVNELLAKASGFDVENIAYAPKEIGKYDWQKNPGWANKIGQGLCALMDLEYGADGPIIKSCGCEPEEDYVCRDCNVPDYYVELSLDTAYGYQGPNGMGCGDLHALLFAVIGAWLDEQGLRWQWYNEFTGEWHESYDGLNELGAGGRKATAWFQDTVKPAILAHAAQSGGTMEF